MSTDVETEQGLKVTAADRKKLRSIHHKLRSGFCFLTVADELPDSDRYALAKNSEINNSISYIRDVEFSDSYKKESIEGIPTNLVKFQLAEYHSSNEREGHDIINLALGENGCVYQCPRQENESYEKLHDSFEDFLYARNQLSALAISKLHAKSMLTTFQSETDEVQARTLETITIIESIERATKESTALLALSTSLEHETIEALNKASEDAQHLRTKQELNSALIGLGISSVSWVCELIDLFITGSAFGGPLGLVGYGLLIVGTAWWFYTEDKRLLNKRQFEDPAYWKGYSSVIGQSYSLMRLIQSKIMPAFPIFAVGVAATTAAFIFGGAVMMLTATSLAWLATSLRKAYTQWDDADRTAMMLDSFSATSLTTACAIGVAVLFTGAAIAGGPFVLAGLVAFSLGIGAFKALRMKYSLKQQSREIQASPHMEENSITNQNLLLSSELPNAINLELDEDQYYGETPYGETELNNTKAGEVYQKQFSNEERPEPVTLLNDLQGELSVVEYDSQHDDFEPGKDTYNIK